MVGPSTKSRGDAAEAAAARFLLARGYEILGTQVRAGGVELDLVVRAPDASVPTIVFVEVRARSGAERGHALETIGPQKQRRLIRGASAWLVERGQCCCRPVNADPLGGGIRRFACRLLG